MAKNMDVGRLSISMVADTVQYVNKMKDAEEKTKKSVNGMNSSFNRMNKTTAKSAKQMNAMSDRLKNMSQTASLVDGPLGGVASRLSVLSTVVASGPLVAGVVALGTAMAGLFAIMRTGLTTLDQTKVQLSQLEAQLNLADGAIGHTVAELDAFARELAINTLTSTVEVREAMGILATTTDLTGESFKRVTKLAQDVSQVMGTSLKANAKVLAKALEDPVDGLTKLERLQVSFTDKQKEMVETMVDNGEVLQAQSFILDQVADKYENIASKLNTDTIAVQADEMGQRWDELGEAIVGVTNTHPELVGFMKSVNIMLAELSKEINPQMFFELDANQKASEVIKGQYGDIINLMGDSAKKSKMLDDISSSESGVAKLQEEVKNLQLVNDTLNESSSIWSSAVAPVGLLNSIKSQFEDEDVKLKLLDKQKELAEAKAYTDQLKSMYNAVSKAESTAEEKRHEKSLNLITEQEKARIDSLMGMSMASDEYIDGLKKETKDWELFTSDNFGTPMDPEYLSNIEADITRIQEIANLLGKDLSNVNFDGMDSLDVDDMLSQYELFLGQKQALDIAYAEEAKKVALAQQQASEMEQQYGVGDSEIDALVDKYAMELDLYKRHLEAMGMARAEANVKEQEMASAMGEELFNQTMANQKQQTDWLTSGLDTAMDAMSALGEEGSDIAKAMFLANQAIAIANAYVSMGVAQAKALELGSVAGPPAYAQATAMGISTIAGIAAASVAGVAHGGMDSVPSESTFLLQKGERVVQPKANKDLTEFLARGGTSGGSTTINAPLTVQGNVTDEAWFESKLVKHRASISNMVAKANRERPSRRGR